jgi:NAD(P)-dependent dehydrogenase (short-subunit alcohol dehydrogenase family)
MVRAWTFDDVPDQSGRTVIVTGANTGIGFETARMLSLKGAHVILACRDKGKGEAAVERIHRQSARAAAQAHRLDLSDLDAIESFATRFMAEHEKLDLLVNNAGVMVPPLGRTRQGFELQMGVNHFGHFALTGRLLPLLEETSGSRAGRVVIVASGMHKFARIDLGDLHWQHRRYVAWAAYGQSKLANMLFALELERRLTRAGSQIRVTAAHPGWTRTDLQRHTALVRFLNPLFSMRPEGGALSTLRAATDPNAAGGSYWGPSRMFELVGPPEKARISARAKDAEVASALFDLSEKMTGVSFFKRESRDREEAPASNLS